MKPGRNGEASPKWLNILPWALPYLYEVKWWSFETISYEMLTGIVSVLCSAFFSFGCNRRADHDLYVYSPMSVRVLQDELHFPDDRAISPDMKTSLMLYVSARFLP